MRDASQLGGPEGVAASVATQGRGTSHRLHRRRNGMRAADGRRSGTRNARPHRYELHGTHHVRAVLRRAVLPVTKSETPSSY